jgi:hypothetical protein
MLSYIPHDGYNERAYIAEEPRLHGALRFVYRPLRVVTRSRHLQAIRGLKDDAAELKSAEVFSQLVLEWDLQDKQGNLLDINPSTLAALKPMLFYKLGAILLGDRASDLDPQWEDEQAAAVAQLAATAAVDGTAVGEVRAEGDLKN